MSLLIDIATCRPSILVSPGVAPDSFLSFLHFYCQALDSLPQLATDCYPVETIMIL